MPTPTPTLVYCKPAARKRDQGNRSSDLSTSTITQTGNETWLVLYDGVVDRATVYGATGLPTIHSANAAGEVVKQVNPIRSADNPHLWEVLVCYQKPQASSSGAVTNISVSVRPDPVDQIVTVDRVGKPLVNTVGDLLPELPKIAHYNYELAIKFECLGTPPNFADLLTYQGWVNDDAISVTICGDTYSFGIRQLKLKCFSFDATKVSNGTSLTYHHSCSLIFQCKGGDDTFVFRCPNVGYRIKDSSGNVVDAKDPKTLSKVTSPIRLTSAGAAKTDNSITWLPDALSDWVAGRFELEDYTAMSGFLTPFAD